MLSYILFIFSELNDYQTTSAAVNQATGHCCSVLFLVVVVGYNVQDSGRLHVNLMPSYDGMLVDRVMDTIIKSRSVSKFQIYLFDSGYYV